MVIGAGTKPTKTPINNQANFYQNKSLRLKVKASSFECKFVFFMTASVVYDNHIKADQ